MYLERDPVSDLRGGGVLASRAASVTRYRSRILRWVLERVVETGVWALVTIESVLESLRRASLHTLEGSIVPFIGYMPETYRSSIGEYETRRPSIRRCFFASDTR